MKLGKMSILLAMLAFAATSVGCKATKEMLTPEPKVVVVTREATVAVPAAAVLGELPSNTPESVPMWPGSSIVSAEMGADKTFTMLSATTEAFSDVSSGMSVGFERAGWKVAETSAEDGFVILEVSDKGYEGVVTIASEEPTVTIDYMLTPVSK